MDNVSDAARWASYLGSFLYIQKWLPANRQWIKILRNSYLCIAIIYVTTPCTLKYWIWSYLLDRGSWWGETSESLSYFDIRTPSLHTLSPQLPVHLKCALSQTSFTTSNFQNQNFTHLPHRRTSPQFDQRHQKTCNKRSAISMVPSLVAFASPKQKPFAGFVAIKVAAGDLNSLYSTAKRLGKWMVRREVNRNYYPQREQNLWRISERRLYAPKCLTPLKDISSTP